MNYKKYKRILVTGAAGFMGSHLVDYLIDRKCNVYGLDDLSGGYMRNVNKKSKFSKIDLRNRKKVEEFIKKVKPDLIYHLAADATEGRSQFTPLECTDRNYLSYLNLLVPAIKNGLKRIVVVSSMATYGNQKPPFTEKQEPRPEDIYGISKAAMEQATEVLSSVHGFEYVVIRPHNVYGPRQKKADPYRNVVGIFINRLLGNKPYYIYGDGMQKRSFTYIDDCTPPLAQSGFSSKVVGEAINIGPEDEVTIKKLSQVIMKEFFKNQPKKKNLDPIYLPARPREVKFAYSSYKKAKKLLNYQPKTDLETGVRKMIEWSREIGYEKPEYLDKVELISKDIPKTWKKKLI